MLNSKINQIITRGVAIPAHPLALTAERKLDERRQRALARYYIAAGVGGLAVGVHTTQFAIRDPHIGLFKPVLELAKDEMDRADVARTQPLVRIAGVCGDTPQAVKEAQLLSDLGYHAGLLSLAALSGTDEASLIKHCRSVAEVIPVVGFYLQASVGGFRLSSSFWREFAKIENVVAIKMAPFNRYQTIDVVRGVSESGRSIPLYTGNDDNIVMDLLTPYVFPTENGPKESRIVGGLLGHWSVWAKKAVELFDECQQVSLGTGIASKELLQRSIEVTDSNAAFFDVWNHFHGCIAGLHEVLRRQGLLEGIWCLDPKEGLGVGQLDEINRVYAAYPHLNDDEFVREGLDEWLKP